MESLTNLVAAAKQGSNDAVAELINLVAKRAKYIALDYADYDDAKAEDIVQQAYIRAFEHLDTLKDPEKFINWFCVIVHNLGKNAADPSKIDENSSNFSDLGDDDMEFEEIAPGNYPEFHPKETFDYTELQEGVKKLLEPLPKIQQMTIKAYYFDGYNMREIADIFGTGESTIRMRINSAKKKMASYIKEMELKGTPLFGAVPASIFNWYFNTEMATVTVSAPNIPAIMAASGLTKASASVGAATEAAKKTGVSFLKTALGKFVVGSFVIIGGLIWLDSYIESNKPHEAPSFYEDWDVHPSSLMKDQLDAPEWKERVTKVLHEAYDNYGARNFNLIDVNSDGIPEVFFDTSDETVYFIVLNQETGKFGGMTEGKSYDEDVRVPSGVAIFVNKNNSSVEIMNYTGDSRPDYVSIYYLSDNKDGSFTQDERNKFDIVDQYPSASSQYAVSAGAVKQPAYTLDEALEMVERW